MHILPEGQQHYAVCFFGYTENSAGKIVNQEIYLKEIITLFVINP
jgi:hypothetical protein